MFCFFFKKKSGADHPLPKGIDRLRMHQRPSTNRQPSPSFSAVVDFSDSSCKALRLDETRNACGETASPKKMCVVSVPLLGRIPYCINSPKLMAGTQRLVLRVDVSPFPRVHFKVPCSSSGGVLHLFKQIRFEFQFRKAASKRQSLRMGLSLQDFHDLIFVLKLLAQMTPC